MTFAEKLLALRRARGWSQEELAAQVGVSRQALSKWENGAAMPDAENILAIAKIFGVTTDYLLLSEHYAVGTPMARMQTAKQANTRMLVRHFGIAVMALGLAGILVLCILSSAFPADYQAAVVAVEDIGPNRQFDLIQRRGLEAYLYVHNIDWLFDLCAGLSVVGLVTIISPNLFDFISKLYKSIRHR